MPIHLSVSTDRLAKMEAAQIPTCKPTAVTPAERDIPKCAALPEQAPPAKPPQPPSKTPSNAEGPGQPSAWAEVETVLKRHHYNPDLQAVKALFAAICAHRLTGAQVWPMCVAPPGSMKTHVLTSLACLPNVHFIDKLTPNAFISGQLEDPLRPSTKPSSLLHRIGKDGIVIYPDFSTVLGMTSDNRASVLADMRRIYDGSLTKEFGTAEQSESRTWEGRITFVVAVTGAIDGYYSVFSTLGERFVMIRWPRADGVEAALVAMNQNTEQAKGELKAAVGALFDQLPHINPELPPDIQLKIATLTEIAVRGRTHIERSGYNKHIFYVPEAESPTRLAQQLAQLAKGAALLEGRDLVNETDLELVRRVAFDCIPPVRSKIIMALVEGRSLNDLGVPASTLKYAVEELQAHDLMTNRGLSERCTGLVEAAGLRKAKT